jgi:hypothetical protein
VTAHHVVYQQHVRRAGGDLNDPRNLMVVSDAEHERHHNRSRPFQLSRLPDSAFEFAAELLGPDAAFNYLRRRYVGDDLRLDALLETLQPASGELAG